MLARHVIGLQGSRSIMLIDFRKAQIIPGLSHKHHLAQKEAAGLAGSLQWLRPKVGIQTSLLCMQT